MDAQPAAMNDVHSGVEPHIVTSLPGDILRLAFGELATSLDDDAEEDQDELNGWNLQNFGHARSLAAVTLASVCLPWRHQALRMAMLWSSILIPAMYEPRHPQVIADYMELMLNRSTMAPLTIHVCWDNVQVHAPFSRPIQRHLAFHRTSCISVA